ncbi:MAG: substrate-binding domain-containing protein, partial [Methanothrix sp.]|nr:substrate-binding domain-containing protein [Methanothrix sp.]
LRTKLLFISKYDLGKQISLKELANYPIILPERGSATRDYLIRSFRARDLTITNSIDCENPPAILHMVELGMGGAFFHLFSIQRDIQEGRFHMAEVKEDLSLDYDLIFLKDRRRSHMVRIFISAMKKLQKSLST